MKLYDLTVKLLRSDKRYRNSDKELMWTIWQESGFIKGGILTRDAFLNEACPTPESITRCRRKVQEEFPELEADRPVQEGRDRKAKEKGTHVYRETVGDKAHGHWDFSTGNARWIEDKV